MTVEQHAKGLKYWLQESSPKASCIEKAPNVTIFHKTFQGQQNLTRMQNGRNMMPTCPQLYSYI